MNSIMNEYGVIGSLLIDSSLFPEAAGLPDQAFSSPALQEVFRTMRRQYEGRGGFDALTVSVEARRNCPEVTDELLAQMMDITPTTANLDAYIAAVKEEFLARSLREIGAGLMEAEQAPLEALGRVQDALQRLTEENTRGDIRAFMERRSGRQLVFEYCTPTGEEQMGNLEEMTADNGEFLRVLSGNRLSDLDGLIKYEMGRMHEQH